MSTSAGNPAPPHVLIAGGGVAGLEAGLALRDLLHDRVSLTLLAPAREFVYRPMTVREPFSLGSAERYPLPEIARDIDADLVQDSLAGVDPSGRTVQTESGAELPYDVLMLGLGAHAHVRYEHAVTIDDTRMDELLHGLIQDVEGGYVKRLAFVMPAPVAWPLPIYELALMTSRRAYEMNVEVAITIATPEDAPLALFGQGASAAVADLLARNRIDLITSAYCEVPQSRRLEISPGDRTLEVDRIVALPELEGPSVPGLPEGSHGFIPVDAHCQVRDTERVYAAGDATDFPVKFGGIAAQQADTAAQAIAALAGAQIDPQPFKPEIHGVLLTGEKPRYLSARITGGQGFSSELTDEPTSSPPAKIAAKYLAPYLEERERTAGGS